MTDDIKFQEDYKYDFKDEDVSVLKTDVGLNEDIVKEISRLKNEPEWMTEFRLKALKAFKAVPLPKFGPDLSYLDFDSYTYFTRPSKKEVQNWDEVPETIKNTFTKLGIPEAEQKYFLNKSGYNFNAISVDKKITPLSDISFNMLWYTTSDSY